jgi:hypothetical protein
MKTVDNLSYIGALITIKTSKINRLSGINKIKKDQISSNSIEAIPIFKNQNNFWIN